MSFFYEGIRRMDWGFGNPNHAAALIATLMISVWAFAFWKKWGFWLALACFFGLGACLLQTFSRGGLVAAIAGCFVVAFFSSKPWPRAKLVAILLAATILGVYASLLTATDRYASSWQGDPSVLNRLDLWKNVPRMIVDAPQGWGLGQSQHAYGQWYQGVDREERFLNLVSLHFTLLAELGWPLRVAYLLFWCLGAVLTLPGKHHRELAVPFAIWITFFVAGLFSHFGRSWLVYLPPLAALGYACYIRWRGQFWPRPFAFASCGIATLLAVLMVIVAGSAKSSPAIESAANRVVVGNSEPLGWVLVSPTVLGSRYGRILRRNWTNRSDYPALGFVTRMADIPPGASVILCGAVDDASLKTLGDKQPKRILLLNTNLFPGQFKTATSAPAEAIFGEFAHSEALAVWRQSQDTSILPGVGDYLPEWPALLFEKLDQQ